MPRICPDCDVPLQKKDYQGVTLDTCAKCAGIYFDEGEVNEVRHRSPQAFEELDTVVQPQEKAEAFSAHHTRTCPGCGHGMTPYRYLYSSPIMLDSCDRCGGIWVQNGELKQMADYVRTMEHHQPPKPVVTEMPSATSESIARAKVAERTMRYMSRRLVG